jgi:2-iminoacetate synthase ThiH
MTLPDNIQNKKLRRIAEKVCNNIPVGKEDALYMLTTHDILDLGTIAHHIRTKLHEDIANCMRILHITGLI